MQRTQPIQMLAFLLVATLSGCAGLELAGGIATEAPVARGEVAQGEAAPAAAVAAAEPEVVTLPLARQQPDRGPPSARAVRGATPATLAASVPPSPAGREIPDPSASSAFDVVPVFWGTDRKLTTGIPLASGPAPASPAGIVTGSVDKVALPGAERGDRLLTGRSYVTVPRIAREKGSIQRPRHVAYLNVTFYAENEDPRRHFTLGSFEPMDQAGLAHASNLHLAKARRNPGQAFVFVHGFNATFEDALYRTAQLAHDLEFDGVPYLYSWPSSGTETGYLYDRDSADRTRRFFTQFLEQIASQTKVQKIHLIAHSLGNRPLLEALRAGGDPGKLAKRLKLDQIVLAAPDVDRDLFVEIARALQGSGRGTTLFAANNDKALRLSRTLARGVPRAGDVPAGGPVVVAGIETIDITAAGTDAFLSVNHNTYVEGGHVLADLRALLRDGVHPPDRRFPVYRPQTTAAGTYWKYVRN